MSGSSSSQDHAEWVRQLHDPWSRRAARQKLVAARADMVEKVLAKEDTR